MFRAVASLTILLTATPLMASPAAERLEAEARKAMHTIVLARTLASGCPQVDWQHDAAISFYRPIEERISAGLSATEAKELRRLMERTGNNMAMATVSAELARDYGLSSYEATPDAAQAGTYCAALASEQAKQPALAQLLRWK